MIQVYIINHKNRDAASTASAIASEGWPCRVMTDQSDHYLKRGHPRLRGLVDNYRATLLAGQQCGADWVFVIHDDVSVPAGLRHRVETVVSAAPPSAKLISFFGPRNKLYERARGEGYHVVESMRNFWGPAMLFKRSALLPINAWTAAHCHRAWEQNGDGPGEDDAIILACSEFRWPVRTILPSFVQHTGLDDSILGNPASIAGRERSAPWHVPDFDVTSVDWQQAFARPLVDKGLVGRTHKWAKRAIW